MQTERFASDAAPRLAGTRWSLPATLNLGGLVLPTRETMVVVVASLVLLFEYYTVVPFGDALLNQALERAVLYGVVPLIVLLLLREDPMDYGLRIGAWRIGLVAAVLAALVVTPVIVMASGWTDVHAYYHQDRLDIGRVVVASTLELSAAEFIYRGFLMMALIRWCGPIGVAGDVVVDLDPFSADITGTKATHCVTTTPAIAAAIIANPLGYYVNVHTTDFPGGAIRGQLGD